jgi:hypothetical protein
MKKNAMLKIAAILMVAVLLTTCAISSTFAKYVSPTVNLAAAQARVAKWGINITATKADGKDLFLNSYDGTVTGTSNALVVAPGTANAASPFAVEISSDEDAPEVKYQIVVTSNFDIANWTTTGSDFYCPLVIKIGSTTVEGLKFNSETEFEAAVNKAFASAILGTETTVNDEGKFVRVYEAGNKPTTVTAANTAITWSWAFSTGDANDAKDTILGDNANATVKLDFSVGAEQID